MPATVPVQAKLWYEERQPAIGVQFVIRLVRTDNNALAIYGNDNMPARTLFYLSSNDDGVDTIDLVPNSRFSVPTIYEFEIQEERAGVTRTSRFSVPDEDPPDNPGHLRLEDLLAFRDSPTTFAFERGWRLQPTAPADPDDGAGWLNSDTGVLSYWDGETWVVIAGEDEEPLTPDQIAALDQVPTNTENIGLLGERVQELEDAQPEPPEPVDPPVTADAYVYADTEDPVDLLGLPTTGTRLVLNDRSYTHRVSQEVPDGASFIMIIPDNVLPTTITQLGLDVESDYATNDTVLLLGVNYHVYKRLNSSGRTLSYTLTLSK